MTKEEFYKYLEEKVKRFQAYWEEAYQKDPELWPSEMPLPDWFEQFELFED
jgi:hypothetical protein